MSEQKIFSISSGAIIKVILFGLLLAFLYAIIDIIVLVFLSIVIASAVRPAAKKLQKYYIPKVLSVLLVYLISFGIFVLAFYLIIPPLYFEVSDFLTLKQVSISDIPLKIIPEFQKNIGLPFSFPDVLKEASSVYQEFLPKIPRGFFSIASMIFGGAASFLFVIIISFYLSVQEGGIERFLQIVTPAQYEPYILGLWERSQKKIGKWLSGQLLLGILVGSFVFIGLSILRIKYALALSILAFIFELIPVFGPILAAIPAIIFAFLQEPWLAIAVLFLYIIIQQFENHLIYPLVVKKVIGIPAIVVILALIIGSKLAGFLGIVLSVPVTVIVMELLNDIAKKKQLM